MTVFVSHASAIGNVGIGVDLEDSGIVSGRFEFGLLDVQS